VFSKRSDERGPAGAERTARGEVETVAAGATCSFWSGPRRIVVSASETIAPTLPALQAGGG